MYRVTTIILILRLIQIQGQTENSNCGRLLPNVSSRLHDTYETQQHWPWHAAIYHNKTSDSDYQCGGTVITAKSILTAAHCVCIENVQLDPKTVSVSLGRLTLSEDRQFFEVAEIIVHPSYNSRDFANDIAILILSVEITFNDYVQPICLWKSNKTDISEVIGKLGTVVGWGLTEEDQLSNVLRQATLPVVSWGPCLKSNPDIFGRLLTERNFCAGYENSTGPCQGDSGGSMTFKENGIFYIRGLVSVSPSKVNRISMEIVCDSSQYALFTDVAKYLQWIKDNSKINDCETRVQCRFHDSFQHNCGVDIEHSARNCRIIFDGVSRTGVTKLFLHMEFDVIPDLSDAVDKFENFEELTMRGVKLKIVERFKLSILGLRLKLLDLSDNKISHLDANTFDDLQNLEKFYCTHNNMKHIPADIFKKLTNLGVVLLSNNMFKDIPSDLFKDLSNITSIALDHSQLTVLQRDIFLNNKKLKSLNLSNNKISRIEVDFSDFPNLQILDLEENVCINEDCITIFRCPSFNDIFDHIRTNCSN